MSVRSSEHPGRAAGVSPRFSLVAAAVAALLLAPPTAGAAPEEIQVYMNEMDPQGQFGLDVHNNYTFSGSAALDYPGEQSDVRRYRLTPEFSYGLTSNIELGAYLPLATLDSRGDLALDGVKGRIKYIGPQSSETAWWGLNLEIGRVDRALDINPWNGELKLIAGARFGRWTLAANGNLDFVVSGPRRDPPTLDVDTKLAYRVAKQLQLGLETYNGLGPFSRLGDFARQDQAVYAVADASVRKWDLNLGLGHGYGGSKDGWVLKAIVGVPIE